MGIVQNEYIIKKGFFKMIKHVQKKNYECAI